MNLRDVIQKSVERHPDRTALVHGEEKYSYRELGEEASRVAGGLRSQGVGKGDLVAVSGPNVPGVLFSILGIWFNGSTCVHVNPKVDASEFPYYIEDSGAETLIFHQSIREKIDRVKDSLDTELVQVGGESDWTKSFAEMEGSYEEVEIDEDETASVTYTSGTTGKPKGVPYAHRRLLNGTVILVVEVQEALGRDLAVEEDVRERQETGPLPFRESEVDALLIRSEPWKEDRHGIIYPLYHVSGTNPSLATLLAGGSIVLPEGREPGEVLEAFERHGVTLTGGVPTQLKDLSHRAGDFDVSSLEYVHTAGGMLPDNVREEVKERLCENICHEYASSETLEIAYSLDGSGALGRPTCLQNVRIVEPGTLEETGDRGEVAVDTDGPTVFDGYWGNPENAKGAIEEGWYRTGDIVEVDEEGRMWFVGRADDLLVSGGENIAPSEVENALLDHEEVESAGVVGVPDERWGEKVVAFVSGGDEEELDEHCLRSGLADFKRPKEYVFMDALPEKETGGVSRNELKRIYERE